MALLKCWAAYKCVVEVTSFSISSSVPVSAPRYQQHLSFSVTITSLDTGKGLSTSLLLENLLPKGSLTCFGETQTNTSLAYKSISNELFISKAPWNSDKENTGSLIGNKKLLGQMLLGWWWQECIYYNSTHYV